MDEKGVTRTASKTAPASPSTALSSASDSKGAAIATTRPLYSSKLGVTKPKAPESNSSPTTRQAPAPQHKAWTTANPKITARSNSPQLKNSTDSAVNKPALANFFNRVREGNRVQITLDNGAEFEGIYANNPTNPSSCHLKMVQQKKAGSADAMNGSTKRQQNNMSFARGNIADGRVMGGNQNNRNGNRVGFQTDSGITGERFGGQRELKRWVADGPGDVDGSLEKTTDNKPWDQFAANEEKFGLKTDYDENIYTTAIDRSHPSYKTRMAKADQMAREIERSNPPSSHVAEERVVDYAGPADGGLDEEEKYSGVKRPDYPPLGSQNPNKYTPPARRAPAAQSTVKGAPVDPAIISSQLRSGPSKQPTPKLDESKVTLPNSTKAPAAQNSEPNATDAKSDGKKEANKDESKPNDTEKGQPDTKSAEKPATTSRPAGASGRTTSPADKENVKPTSTTIEQTVLTSFKNFASKERQVAEKVRSTKAKADKEVKLIELKKFADSFKLGTPVPSDLIGIIAKDPKKQQEIQAKALKNAEESRKAKEDAKKDPVTKEKEVITAKPGQSKPATEQAASATAGTLAAAAAGAASGGASRPGVAPQHANSNVGGSNRHPGNRQSYAPGAYPQQFRGDRSSGQNVPRQHQQPGHLSQRLRSAEQQRMSQPPPHMQPDMRMPPTGPANSLNPSFPRHAGLPPNHMGPGPRLNPNTQEFRPTAQTFYPTGPSAASSPRSALNNVEGQGSSTPVTGPVVKRKIKTIDIKKCFALSHVMSIKQPQTGNNRAWEENGGLRPPFDTMPTWNSLSEGDDKQEKISYKQLFERPPPYAGAMPTPNPAPVAPQMPHQHQLPFHLQQGAHAVGPRQSPHMPPLQMHAGQPGHAPHMPFNNGEDATRMMPSTSAQSYASPRPGQVPMAYPNAMNSPAHMPYSQPVMPGFMGPGAPQMTPQMRNFAQNPQYMPQQHAQMGGGPMMMGPQYMTAPSPLMQGGPQMPMYAPGAHPQFMPPGPVPPPTMPGSNGYPSPGRPAAPMMAPQGSQQGQHMYGMSPGTMPQYQQPVFAPQQPGQMGNMRVHSNPGPQQLGSSPQQVHHFGPHQHRGNGYGGKNFTGPPHGPSTNHGGPAVAQARTPETLDPTK